jgi:cytosine/creatinine deaminase
VDILISNALLSSGEQVDIAIQDGTVRAVAPHIDSNAETVIAAAGQLALPAFVNGQLHACKVFWGRILKTLPAQVQALPRFQAAQQVKARYTVNDVISRVDEVMRLAIRAGTCAIRLFADVDEANGLTALQGLLEIKRRYSPYMTVQVVAFPQDGVLGAYTQQLMDEALNIGADVVGGIPWIERGLDAQHAHTRMCFELAERYGKPLHLVADDTTDPASRTLERIAQETLERKLQGQVCVTQATALSFQEDDYAAHVIKLLKKADITVFSNSHVSLITTQLTPPPYPRGITRLPELLAAGVRVACAQDDIDNWYYPFGRNSMLEVAQFMTHVGGFGWQPDQTLPMVTDVPAAALGLNDYGLTEGAEANLVLLPVTSWHEALQFQPEVRCVILKGQVAATTERQEHWQLPV